MPGFKKFGYHVLGRSTGISSRTHACKHTKAQDMSFGGRYCPTCNKTIIQPTIDEGWEIDKKSFQFVRKSDGEAVHQSVFMNKVGLRIVSTEEGTRILNQIVRDRRRI